MAVPLGRETIWSAFFALLVPLRSSNGGPFQVVSRRAIHYADAVAQPALYVLQRRDEAKVRDRGIPTIWDLHAWLFIYARNEINSQAPDSGGGQVLNPLIDAVEGALAPIAVQGNVQSLGGLVSRVVIDGQVEIDEGNLDNQSVAIIPIRIVAPT